MTYILAAEALRVVERNDRGIVTYRKRYKKNDEVDTSHMDEAHVENLVRSGRLVESDTDTSDNTNLDAVTPSAESVATGTDAGTNATQGAGPVSQTDEAGGDADADIEDDDNAGGDRYDGMSYPELRAEASARDGVNANGSAEDLRARLREDDKSSDDES